jgi:hypothetical protein
MYIDQLRRNGVSKSAFFKSAWQVVRAIVLSDCIGHRDWPSTTDECDDLANEWAKLSGPPGRRGLFLSVVGMLDGLLIVTRCPSSKEVNNAEDFRSGHKKAIGLNCQALCDASLAFLFVSCMTPGKTNDLKAYQSSKLSELIEALPDGYWVGGDNAYVNTEHMLVPHPGAHAVAEDAFNFYLSQLRVRIENAFALLVNRWGILWRPLRVPLRRQPELVLCLAKLHNYCIDEKEPQPPLVGPNAMVPSPRAEVQYDEEIQALRFKRQDWKTNYQFQRTAAGTELRDSLTTEIENLNYERPPAHNVQRRSTTA